MSYADASLDLTHVPIVCLTGSNGAGKSALLDALTWTLWESGRSGSDELIRLGEKEMWTDLVFAHEGERYRVRRSRQKMSVKGGAKITSKGTLEFQVLNRPKQMQPEAIAAGAVGTATVELKKEGETIGGGWRSLTAASVRQTQKAICDLLRMDFDTFVNSAYLRQGKADEFTTRPPSERKQVLCEILGLSYYDRLQEKAKERVRALKLETEVVSRELTNLPNVESALKESQEKLAGTQQELGASEERLVLLETSLDKITAELASLQVARERLQLGEDHARSLRADIITLQKQNDELTKQIEAITTMLERSLEIEAAAIHFEQLKSKVETLDKHAFEVNELNAKKMTHQTQLATMRAKLEVESASLATKLKEWEEKAQKLAKDTTEKEKISQAYVEYRRSLADEADLASRQEAFARLTNRANELGSQIIESKIRLEADLNQKESVLAEYKIVLKSQDDLEEQKSGLETETKQLDRLEAEFQMIEENGLKIKSAIASKQHKIETLRLQQREKNGKIDELHVHADSTICPLCSAPIIDRAAVVSRYRQEIEDMDYEITRESAAIETLELERAELRKKYADVRARLQRRQALDKQIGQFNEKLVAVERAKDSHGKLEKEVQTLKNRLEQELYAQLERESLIAVKTELHKLEFDPIAYANLQSQIRMQRHVEARYQQLQRDLVDKRKIDETLPEVQEQLKKLQDALSGESYGVEERKLVAEIQTKIASFGYDRTAHAELKEELAKLLPSNELRRELQIAVAEKPKLEESQRSCANQLKTKNELLMTFETEREKLTESLNSMPQLQSEAEELKPQIVTAKSDRDIVAKQMAVLEAECRNFDRDLSHLSRSQSRLTELNERLDDHQFLAEAFGKKGIQAVIIENAIPEIEAESNRILSRLTENKMHVAFITQQKNKSGGINETLDLLIGDELGTRNYEMFSGGEAFKVNFAVRVALSRLLARRSGAKLETLIIDEGFGSQDEYSRERLVRSIQAIQNEFARIIVITHMSDIKEMFPVQILVSKVRGASELQVMY
jgi:exonuclease SbcC